ncbi:hypothetical protein BG74_02455 [Sodalis-like endosymbiont of Proechinophthirus fluctus]|nr:hypothetical protein BG74_02455 [Sodalis-like endosymbiont of Proechinophthirus fluctus]
MTIARIGHNCGAALIQGIHIVIIIFTWPKMPRRIKLPLSITSSAGLSTEQIAAGAQPFQIHVLIIIINLRKRQKFIIVTR